MAQFSSAQNGTAPTVSTTNVNTAVLYSTTAGSVLLVKMINWGGSDTSLIGHISRMARVTNTPATPTSLNIEPTNPGGSAGVGLSATFSTAATATAVPHGLFQQAWNSQGGGGAIVLPIGGEWMIVGAALGTAGDAIGWGDSAGTASANTTYGYQWAE